MIPLDDNRIVQVLGDGVYESFAGPSADKITFMRSIDIAGLEAREINLAAEDYYKPGSCAVEVNTQSVTAFHIVAFLHHPASGTDPGPQCELARKTATALARRYVPLAGGTPWPGTPQQPKTVSENACRLVQVDVVSGYIEQPGEPGSDGDASTCTYTSGDARAVAWLASTPPSGWTSTLPSLGEGDLAADTTLGELPAHVQLSADGTICAETTELPAGHVLRIAYQNPRFDAPVLCRIAEEILGNVVGRSADQTA